MSEAILPGSYSSGTGSMWVHIGTYSNTTTELFVDGPNDTANIDSDFVILVASLVYPNVIVHSGNGYGYINMYGARLSDGVGVQGDTYQFTLYRGANKIKYNAMEYMWLCSFSSDGYPIYKKLNFLYPLMTIDDVNYNHHDGDKGAMIVDLYGMPAPGYAG